MDNKKFSNHTGSDASTIFSRVSDEEYISNNLAQNIGNGQREVQRIIDTVS